LAVAVELGEYQRLDDPLHLVLAGLQLSQIEADDLKAREIAKILALPLRLVGNNGDLPAAPLDSLDPYAVVVVELLGAKDEPVVVLVGQLELFLEELIGPGIERHFGGFLGDRRCVLHAGVIVPFAAVAADELRAVVQRGALGAVLGLLGPLL